MACDVSIRASHPTFDLQWLTTATSLQPDLVQLSGASYVGHGGRLRTHKKSLWIVKFDDDEDLAVLVDRAIAAIEKNQEKFEKVKSQGGNVDLFAGLFPDGQIGFTFSVSLLQRIAAAGFEFHCTAYGWDRAS